MSGCLLFILVAFIFFPLLFGVRTLFSIIHLIFGGRRRRDNTSRHQQSKEKPVSQDERIIEYKKKEFEISTAEDVDFEEIKDSKDNKE